MLVLIRYEGEWICLRDRETGTEIWVGVEFDNFIPSIPRIKVAIDAPQRIHIIRGELIERDADNQNKEWTANHG